MRAHPFFKRTGDDVVCTVPITFTHAALGGDVEVPTLDGKGKLRVPAGTQPGTVLRIKSKGIPHRGGLGRGDQRVEIAIEVPTKLTERQSVLLEDLQRELGEEVQPQRRTFMEKLRDLFVELEFHSLAEEIGSEGAAAPEIDFARLEAVADKRCGAFLMEHAAVGRLAGGDVGFHCRGSGLVARECHPTDGRARCVTLTAKGRKVFKKLWTKSEPLRARLLGAFGPDEVTDRDRPPLMNAAVYTKRVHPEPPSGGFPRSGVGPPLRAG